MNKIITYDNLRYFAYVNDNICTKPIRGVVVDFFGQGDCSMFWEDTEIGEFYAEKGILFVVPYTNPWAWMNTQTIAFTDEIVDILFDKYDLSENIPMVYSGISMGGLGALVYTKYSKRTPVACVTNCPVCDLPYHYIEKDYQPRSLYSAFYNEEGDLDSVLKRFSPYHLAEEMPDIKYYIFHCDEDQAVNINKHSENFVSEMIKKGKDITYEIVHGRAHVDLTPEAFELYKEYICSNIK